MTMVRIIQMCEEHKYEVVNTYFEYKDEHKYTWDQPTKQLKSVIYYS